MGFVEHDDMVQTLAADRTNHPLTVRILPGRTCGNQHFLDAQVLHPRLELLAIDAIAVTQKKTWGLFVGKGVDNLLRSPYSIGMSSDVKVNDPSPVMREDDEHVQHAEGDGRDGEEIHGRDEFSMVAQESQPTPRWIGCSHMSPHPAGDGSFRNVETEHHQFAVDARCSPGRVLVSHPGNQLLQLRRDSPSANPTHS